MQPPVAHPVQLPTFSPAPFGTCAAPCVVSFALPSIQLQYSVEHRPAQRSASRGASYSLSDVLYDCSVVQCHLQDPASCPSSCLMWKLLSCVRHTVTVESLFKRPAPCPPSSPAPSVHHFVQLPAFAKHQHHVQRSIPASRFLLKHAASYSASTAMSSTMSIV